MEYLIRLVQVHELFRRPEIKALAEVAGIKIEIISYSADSPYSIIRLRNEAEARVLMQRSILGKAIYELWGAGETYDELHNDVRKRSSHLWSLYEHTSFKFDVDSFRGKRSSGEQSRIIESFNYLGLDGPIKMISPEQQFCVFEHWLYKSASPRRLYLGRWVANGGREIIHKYDLKKRKYISTTSMDSELALITANLSLAGPGKLFYDPFVGTGSFPIACAHFGAMTLGSDIDGRTIRGSEGTNVLHNFNQYQLESRWINGFIADLTNSPIRKAARWLDGIVCDPPYGVREGLKVLGRRDPEKQSREGVLVNGKPSHLQYEGEKRQTHFVPPKKPYSFVVMLNDILEFSASSLVDHGRLSLWMPTANDALEEFEIPSNRYLVLVSVCVQPFNKWSRRLLTYRRLPDSDILRSDPARPQRGTKATATTGLGVNADDLNPFRKRVISRPFP